ncbi:hypothetical protein [Paramaledivibacter caminithermalis]|uniref:Uncharacterized protein n=1 Tax=Paramaledivibacter caminithermalis (strain DSM 15212 / CIP 107654 / DViRD3) TaxID=1121301 RepID=A0A1M6K5G8_PARC5|nr:hypothetical protein [Paramaledivibacter caminithermalis]SHJ54182.1 hypothetical protein SAMN02745912_00271 [Paramaledivibacter caminithermalis DSM 15212]
MICPHCGQCIYEDDLEDDIDIKNEDYLMEDMDFELEEDDLNTYDEFEEEIEEFNEKRRGLFDMDLNNEIDLDYIDKF